RRRAGRPPSPRAPCRRARARWPRAGSAAGRPSARFAPGRPRPDRLRPPRELREVGPALLDVGVAALLGLVAHVEEQRGVARQLLDAGEAVLGRVERRLEHPQRQRRKREHLAAPLDGLLLEALERDHGVDEPPVERRPRVVLAAEEPDLLRALL